MERMESDDIQEPCCKHSLCGLQYRLWKVWLYQVHVTAGRFQRTFSLAKNLESIGPSWGDVTYKEHCKRQRQEISRGAVLYKNWITSLNLQSQSHVGQICVKKLQVAKDQLIPTGT